MEKRERSEWGTRPSLRLQRALAGGGPEAVRGLGGGGKRLHKKVPVTGQHQGCPVLKRAAEPMLCLWVQAAGSGHFKEQGERNEIESHGNGNNDDIDGHSKPGLLPSFKDQVSLRSPRCLHAHRAVTREVITNLIGKTRKSIHYWPAERPDFVLGHLVP